MANVKITDLTALTTPAAADLLEIVDDVAGTPTSKKITWANLFKAPVMTTPALGTPSAADLTNATGLPLATGLTPAATLISLEGLTLAAGDILYATAADTLINLAKGTANHKLFTNAGATAPEWANGMKIGYFVFDTATASGDQVITGVGFKPSHIILLAGIGNTSQASIGFDDGTVHYCVYNNHNTLADTWVPNVSYSLELIQNAATGSDGRITAIGADGFTIAWRKAGAKTGSAVILYMAFR